MTQQDDITQRVLTDDEIMRSAISACDSLNITRFHEIGAPSKTIMDDAGLLELGRAIETAVLSQVRAPVVDAGNWQQYRLRGSNETAEQVIERERRAYADLLQSVMDKRRDQASAPVAEPRLEWSAKALYDAIKDVLLNHRLSNLVDEDGEFFPLVDHLCSQDDKTTESGEFEIALICDAIYNDVLTKSAPVAGEAQPVAVTDHQGDVHWRHGRKAGIALYAAPQASAESVRNAALEEAYEAVACLYAAYYQHSKRSESDDILQALKQAGDDIRALKQPQAARGGGQQRAGEVDERAAFEAWAYRAGMGPKFRESMFAAWEARAALSAPQAEQGERDA